MFQKVDSSLSQGIVTAMDRRNKLLFEEPLFLLVCVKTNTMGSYI